MDIRPEAVDDRAAIHALNVAVFETAAEIAGDRRLDLMGLAPMAVLTEHQRRGVGSALVREGLLRCKQLGRQAVVVVGHPEYYPRFGFVPASRYGIRCEYDVPDDVFMIVELVPGALRGAAGVVHYDEAFGNL